MKFLSLATMAAVSMFIALTGCTPEHVRPAIGTFAETVKTATDQGVEVFKDEDLDARALALMLQNHAAQGGVLFKDLGTTGTCAPGRPPTELEIAEAGSRKPLTFDEICGVSPFIRPPGEKPKRVALELPPLKGPGPDGSIPPEDQTVRAYGAREALFALSDYAAAISDLATSEGPEGVATAASGTVLALRDVAGAATKISGSPIPDDLNGVINAGGALLGDITREAFEAKRYALLARIMRSSDSTVAELARAAAAWFYLEEEPKLIAAYDRLNTALKATPRNDLDVMLEIHNAREAARKIEEEATWRTYWQVAVAHEAIIQSLDEPADPDRLKAANDRILGLVKSTKAFTAAVETFKEN